MGDDDILSHAQVSRDQIGDCWLANRLRTESFIADFYGEWLSF
jgi:hypothetical protein